jgi:hypothetical protein
MEEDEEEDGQEEDEVVVLRGAAVFLRGSLWLLKSSRCGHAIR